MPKVNPQLLRLQEEMTEYVAEWCRNYGEIIRKAYQLGRYDERMGLSFDDTPGKVEPRKLTS